MNPEKTPYEKGAWAIVTKRYSIDGIVITARQWRKLARAEGLPVRRTKKHGMGRIMVSTAMKFFPQYFAARQGGEVCRLVYYRPR